MCRLYGFRANQRTRLDCTLVQAQNALMIQSRADSAGVSHADGWGIGYYSNSVPEVERRDTAAYRDLYFATTVERVSARTVLAHIRKATIGPIAPENTHPFRWGHWVFAHNGTIYGFEKLKDRLQQETLPELLACRVGSTDSELAFYWLLSKLDQHGLDLNQRCDDVELLVSVVGQSVRKLDEWSAGTGAKKKAKLNFMLTDGQILLGARWRHTLHWVVREGIRDCEICGIPHVSEGPEEPEYRAAVLASEPISQEKWELVPERHLVLVDRDVQLRVIPIN